jgi:hypothetical protein
MDDLSPRIPDAIEPIAAYRAWFYSIEGRTAQLYPLSGGPTSWLGDAWEGAGTTWVTASCPTIGSQTHEVPSEDCSCGFYSLKELELAVAHAAVFHLMSTHTATQGRGHGQVVLGRILLSGKVIEHDLGYRAERARIAELIPFRGTERSVMVLAHRLGVGIAPAVDAGSQEEALIALVGSPGRPPTPTGAPRKALIDPPADPLTGPGAGVLAIVILIAVSILVLMGVWPQPPIALVFLSLGQLGRSADSMSQMFRDLRDWRASGSNRPRFLPPVPPPAA